MSARLINCSTASRARYAATPTEAVTAKSGAFGSIIINCVWRRSRFETCTASASVRVREHHHEFLAADARDEVFFAHHLARDVGERAQHFVTLFVAEEVVHAFEVVEIDVTQRKCERAAIGQRLLAIQVFHQLTAVVQTR